MRVERLPENVHPLEYETVTFKDMGRYTEIRYGKTNAQPHTKKIDADNYMVIETGEFKQYEHTATRADNIINIKQSMTRLRDIIRTNVKNPAHCRWCSLTYRHIQDSHKQLYEDYRRFNQRFQRYLVTGHSTTAEWIAVAEPQARGAWHMHVIYIFSGKAPYIPNEDLARLWGHGFTKIKALSAADDVALYLSAYIADIPIEEALQQRSISDIKSSELKIAGEGEKAKGFIKGGRISMYPTGMRIYRCSQGIKKPVVSKMMEKEAQKMIADRNGTLTYEKTIALYEADKTVTVYNYRQYKSGDNNAQKETQRLWHEYSAP